MPVDGPVVGGAELAGSDGAHVDLVPLDFGPVGEWLADVPVPLSPAEVGSAQCQGDGLVESDVPVLFPSGDARLDRALVVLDAVAAAESRVFAVKMHALYEAAMGAREADGQRQHDLTSEFLPTHVAGTLTVHRGTALAQLEQARHLVGRLPGTWRLLDAGRLRVGQALVLVQETAGRPRSVCAAVEREVLPWIVGRTAAEVRRRVRRVLRRLDDQAAAARARVEAVAARAVSVLPLPDGMTGIWATMPAGAATVFAAALRQLAGRFATENDQRTAAQRESDLLAVLPSLVLDGLTGRFGPQVQAALAAAGLRPGARAAELTGVLLVPAGSALGLNDEPAELTGYGPVTAEHARVLLRTAAVRLAELDPDTGRILGLSGRCYRPSPADLAGLTGLTAETEPPPATPTGRAQPARPAQSEPPPATPTGRAQPAGPSRSEPATATGADLAGTAAGGAAPGRPEPTKPGRDQDVNRAASQRATPGWYRWLADELADELADKPAGESVDELAGELAGPRTGRRPEPADEPQYRPSAALDRFVRLRDLRCIGIGCSCPAHRCDLEHRDPWPAGPTGPSNLSPVSRRCHRMKQNGWSYARGPDGSTTWTAPGGRSYHKPPDNWPIDALLPAPPQPAPH